MLEALPDLEPASALKQAASDLGIPYGDEMEAFVTWAPHLSPCPRAKNAVRIFTDAKTKKSHQMPDVPQL